MSDTNNLRDLLDRLREETGGLEREAGRKNLPPPGERPGRQFQPEPRREGPYKPYRMPEPRAKEVVQPNPAWSENKEAILFGMLAALIAALGGILAGLEYLVVAGAAMFSLFSLVMCLALLRLIYASARRAPESSTLAERVDTLSKRVELLSSRAVSGGALPAQGGDFRDRELEQKVEELRVMVKSLAKAVENGNKL